MRNRFQLTSGLVSVAIGAALLFTVATASANIATAVEADCFVVSATLESFPEGTHTITFTGDVNGVPFQLQAEATIGEDGTGSASVSIADLTDDPNNQPTTVNVQATWTAGEGGSRDAVTFEGVCAEQPTTPTAPDQPLVGGTQEAAAPVVVLPAAASQVELPRTGADTSPELIALGFVLLLCGFALLGAIKLSRA